jgi:hypothetical protein
LTAYSPRWILGWQLSSVTAGSGVKDLVKQGCGRLAAGWLS